MWRAWLVVLVVLAGACAASPPSDEPPSPRTVPAAATAATEPAGRPPFALTLHVRPKGLSESDLDALIPPAKRLPDYGGWAVLPPTSNGLLNVGLARLVVYIPRRHYEDGLEDEELDEDGRPKDQRVSGYTRADGTRVSSYMRRRPRR